MQAIYSGQQCAKAGTHAVRSLVRRYDCFAA
jgi:hypothetical protein